jgi:urea transporter
LLPKDEYSLVRTGLVGFNGFLLGVAISQFFVPNSSDSELFGIIVAAVLIISAFLPALAYFLSHLYSKLSFPGKSVGEISNIFRFWTGF